MEVRLKEDFKEKYRRILGDEADEFFKSLSKPLNKAIRINTLKTNGKDIFKRLKMRYEWGMKRIPWHSNSYWIKSKDRPLGKTIEHQLGYYYVQDAASLVPVLALDPQPGERVLDLCASPGSKTTQMAQAMDNKGIIVANDVEMKRISILAFNTQRCGASNCVLTVEDGRDFKDKEQKFDKVLVDAPCTGVGTIRGDPSVAKMWSQAGVEGLATIQKQLLGSGYSCLREGGVLTYSTCSLSPEENEGVLDYLLTNKDAEVLEVNFEGLETRSGLLKFDGRDFHKDVEKASRIWPQDNNTEGFFVAKIKK